MAALLTAPLRTPSPKVRIRSQSFSFDSPSSISRLNSTPIEDYPFSKSTGSINTTKALSHHVLFPLKTKMSDESMSDASTVSSESTASSPTDGESTDQDQDQDQDQIMDLPKGNLLGLFCTTSPAQTKPIEPAPAFPPSPSPSAEQIEPISPFAFQDTSYPMYSPWLVRMVLDLYDVHGLSWTDIAEPIGRVWGVQTSSAEVLEILSGNGRVLGRRWWD